MLRAAFVQKIKPLLAGVLLLASMASPVLVHARQSTSADAIAVIAVAELPAQGRQTLQLIRDGGPFPYEQGWHSVRESGAPAARQTAGLLPGIHRENAGSRDIEERDASCVAVSRAHRMPVTTPVIITPASGGLSTDGVEFLICPAPRVATSFIDY
jgi:ribonuclease T1